MEGNTPLYGLSAVLVINRVSILTILVKLIGFRFFEILAILIKTNLYF